MTTDNLTFIDANVLIAAAIDQSAAEHRHAVAFLRWMQEGQETYTLTEAVLTEVAAVLSTKRAGLSRREVSDFLLGVLALPTVEIDEKDAWRRALQLSAEENVDLPDAQMATVGQSAQSCRIITFDSDFGRLPGIAAVHPADAVKK